MFKSLNKGVKPGRNSTQVEKKTRKTKRKSLSKPQTWKELKPKSKTSSKYLVKHQLKNFGWNLNQVRKTTQVRK